jgi:hypothetical protein
VAKITIDVSFYINQTEVIAASRSTTVHFDSWETAAETFEKTRSQIIDSNSTSLKEDAIAPPRRERIFRILPEEQTSNQTEVKSRADSKPELELARPVRKEPKANV